MRKTILPDPLRKISVDLLIATVQAAITDGSYIDDLRVGPKLLMDKSDLSREDLYDIGAACWMIKFRQKHPTEFFCFCCRRYRPIARACYVPFGQTPMCFECGDKASIAHANSESVPNAVLFNNGRLVFFKNDEKARVARRNSSRVKKWLVDSAKYYS